MKKLYSEKEIKESCIKVKRLLPDSDAMDNNFSLQYFNAEISKDFTRNVIFVELTFNIVILSMFPSLTIA